MVVKIVIRTNVLAPTIATSATRSGAISNTKPGTISGQKSRGGVGGVGIRVLFAFVLYFFAF